MKKNGIIFCAALFLSMSIHAINVNNVQVEKLYTQSTNGYKSSAAHAVKVNKPVDNACSERLYIDPEDKALYAAALSYQLSNRIFSLIYVIDSDRKLVNGHVMASCKLISVY